MPNCCMLRFNRGYTVKPVLASTSTKKPTPLSSQGKITTDLKSVLILMSTKQSPFLSSKAKITHDFNFVLNYTSIKQPPFLINHFIVCPITGCVTQVKLYKLN